MTDLLKKIEDLKNGIQEQIDEVVTKLEESKKEEVDVKVDDADDSDDDEKKDESFEQPWDSLIEAGILTLNEKESYKEFFAKKLAKYDVKSPSQLDDKKKKEFFQEIEDGWVSADEK